MGATPFSCTIMLQPVMFPRIAICYSVKNLCAAMLHRSGNSHLIGIRHVPGTDDTRKSLRMDPISIQNCHGNRSIRSLQEALGSSGQHMNCSTLSVYILYGYGALRFWTCCAMESLHVTVHVLHTYIVESIRCLL